MKKTVLASLLIFSSFLLLGQSKDWTTLDLKDLSAFQDQAGNWKIVGDILVNPRVDIHEKPEPPPPLVTTNKKKKRKKRKKQAEQELPPPPPPPKAVETTPGTGILLNENTESQKDHLLTSWEHGDILLDMEVMIPKGSNSGVYLQGRYELQLKDSWGKIKASSYDLGGIHRNWEEEKGKIYMGKAPLSNAAKAPGLWQRLTIAFKAPKFNAQGQKVANARFVYVDLNGQRIHENVEVPLPTGGPIEKNEAANGPLMIQGDHGAMAFRNIRYKLLEENDLRLEDLSYQYYGGEQSNIDALYKEEGSRKGELAVLTTELGDLDDRFAVTYTGQLVAPEKGTYPIRINYRGSIRVRVGNKVISKDLQGNGRTSFNVLLRKGANDFELTYYKDQPWWDPMLGLYDLGSFPRPIPGTSAVASSARRNGPIYVKVADRPRLLRAFLDFNRDRKQRLTHTLGVGTVSGVHFVYDTKAGNLSCSWRGSFVDATPMWNNRGDGSFRPRGAVNYLFTGHSFGILADENAAFPTGLDERDGFKNVGYEIDESTGLPRFQYEVKGITIKDFVQPTSMSTGLTRKLEVKNPGTEKLWLKLAEGQDIEEVEKGLYVIDQRYYISTEDAVGLKIRKQGEKTELICPLESDSFSYTLNW